MKVFFSQNNFVLTTDKTGIGYSLLCSSCYVESKWAHLPASDIISTIIYMVLPSSGRVWAVADMLMGGNPVLRYSNVTLQKNNNWQFENKRPKCMIFWRCDIPHLIKTISFNLDNLSFSLLKESCALFSQIASLIETSTKWPTCCKQYF